MAQLPASAPPGTSAAQRTQVGGSRGLYAILTVLLIVVLLGLDALVLALNNPSQRLANHDYVAVGDSLTFGFEPDGNFIDGFADDLFADLQRANATTLRNYACAGESTTTMLNGHCPNPLFKHIQYDGPQLDAALQFLNAHHGAVNPVTLEMGANDVIQDFNRSTCTIGSNTDADLANMDTNLTQTIIPKLLAALRTPSGPVTGDLVMLNFYNPFAKVCPNSAPFVHMFNDHLAADAAQFRIPLVDVYGAFGGDDHMAANICTYTWACDNAFGDDIHPRPQGYRVIADAVEHALGYPGVGPLQNPMQNPPLQYPVQFGAAMPLLGPRDARLRQREA
ncbi:MAG TPA: SGNH/GDSL hydrolase family protein [Ktedonobacterales bacterium]|nr:SGNH/GDSL hydrolase family protein [Ktedonobacterales bacterium]